MDGALEKINQKKAEKTSVDELHIHLDKQRAESVFNDMKILFDTTVKQFDDKIIHERNKIEASYKRINLEQRHEMDKFKNEYNSLILKKVTKIEDFVNELALEQARILEKLVGLNSN